MAATCRNVLRSALKISRTLKEPSPFINSQSQRQKDLSRCTRCLSALAEHHAPRSRTLFRTQENDPQKHNLNHEGLFYKVDDSDVSGALNGCFEPFLARLMTTFNEHCLMVRQPSIELNGYLSNLNLDHPVPRFVLYGRRGAGKTCSLLHTIHYCTLDNWIVVHVPWAGEWARGPSEFKEVAESTHKPGRYDMPNDAAAWLNHFKTMNQHKFDGLKTKNEYIWTKRERADVGTPILELIEFGLHRVKFSTDCVGAVLKELRQQASSGNLKVLVAVEAVNAFFTPWTLGNAVTNSEKRKLELHEVSLIYNFRKMLSPTWTHGAVVCTVDEASNVPELQKDFKPKYLLGQEGFEWLDPFVPIFIPEYSDKEALSALEYYIDRNWIQNDHAKTENGKKEIMFVSNKNAFSLYKVCSSL